jgi:hypothetical protein
MAVTMKVAVSWDVTPCGCCKKQHFGGTNYFHHLGEKNQGTRNNINSS